MKDGGVVLIGIPVRSGTCPGIIPFFKQMESLSMSLFGETVFWALS